MTSIYEVYDNPDYFGTQKKLLEEIQRLKAENDGLKSQLDFEIQKRETVEAENEKLKKENAILKLITEPQREEIQKYRDKAIQFKQALEEVREYVNSQVDGFGNYVYGITKQQVKDITDKINEVLKDE